MNRRQFLSSGGALVVSFSLYAAQPGEAPQQKGEEPKKAPQLPGNLKNDPWLDSWIRIGADNRITVMTGKVELGQGIKTAMIQVAAEELMVAPGRLILITADTQETPNEAYTAGSQSMPDGATALMNAAAQVRAILLGWAAETFKLGADRLSIQDGTVHAPDGRSRTYGELVAGRSLHVQAEPRSPLRDPAKRDVMGKSLPRVDIPAKLTGQPIYVQDLRLPGMVHARVVRPPSQGARLTALDAQAAQRLSGVLKVVRDGNFLAVLAEREYQAVVAMRALAGAAKWEEPQRLPARDFYEAFQKMTRQDRLILERREAPGASGVDFEATYRRPYVMHGSIGPSCAVGLAQDGRVTVWTHSQGVYPLRDAIAQMLRMPPEQVRCVHMEGSGCYGHNGADDAGADAARIAALYPGRPVRVQWMREDEHAWEPYGSAMIGHVRARLDASGRIVDWNYEVWSHSHLTRPGPAGNLSTAWLLDPPFEQPVPKPLPQPAGGGDRNAIPLYAFPNMRVMHHFVTQMPLRVSALRALGGYHNVFTLESFMDELAAAARADPVEFRLRHLRDARARDVVNMAAQRFDWAGYKRSGGRGRGFAFARYKNLAAYAAVALEVEVERSTGRVQVARAVAAIDSGEAVNPDGIVNQTEGSIIQSISWTLFEAVAFDAQRITSRDWSSYPILRFDSVPRRIEVHVINRPGQPFLGTGEAMQGPAAAALGNALADATGVRMRDLPLTPARVRSAVGA